jgi:two-component system, chemotaxis family, chemotaxis protein CheY
MGAMEQAFSQLIDGLALIAHERASERSFTVSLARHVGLRNIRQAQNGEEALWLLRQERFQIALIDWELGGMTVPDFVYQVRRLEDRAKRGMPIVLLTARANRADIDLALGCGVDSYIVKPVAAAVLAKRLDVAISQQRPFVACATYVGPCRRRGHAPDYTGPWRRESDKTAIVEVEEPAADPKAVMRENARARLDSLALRLSSIEEGHAEGMQRFTHDIQAVRAIAVELEDPVLEKGVLLLAPYMAGKVKFFDEARTHLHALRHLTGRHALEGAQREAIALELQRMADKTAERKRSRV